MRAGEEERRYEKGGKGAQGEEPEEEKA